MIKLIPLSLLLRMAYAIPFPQLSDTDSICSISYSDRQKAWFDSGAGTFLNDFIQQNGEANWANKIDHTTTGTGAQESNLICTDLLGGNCPFPSLQCNVFTPPALFHLRNGMANAYSSFNSMHEELQNAAIDLSLRADKVIADFGPPETKEVNVNAMMSAAFTVAAGLTGANPIIGGIMTIFSGAFGILGNLPEPAGPIDPSEDIKAALADAFSNTEDYIQEVTKLLFGGGGDTSKLPGLGATENDQGSVGNEQGPASKRQSSRFTNIARFFDKGVYLPDTTGAAAANPELPAVIEGMKNSLVHMMIGLSLEGHGYVIVVTTKNQDACGKASATSARFIGGECFELVRFGGETLPQETMKKLESGAEYNFDLDAFYKNSDACSKAFPNLCPGNEPKLAVDNLLLDGSLPLCFFKIRTFRVNSEDSNMTLFFSDTCP